ncbi:MAG: NADH-quinone oxidoreductase subunit N [Gemmataceae bacterium]
MLPLAVVEWKDAVTLKGVFTLVVPEAVLLATACIIFLGGTVKASRHVWGSFSLVALALAAFALWNTGVPEGFKRAESPLLDDNLAVFVRWVALLGGATFVLLCWDELKDEHAADFFACFLVLVAGVSLAGAANELITLFLSLELISIPTYVLLYLPRSNKASQEAAIKYFLLSIFSSGLLLFGFSYLYGVSGTTNLTSLFQGHGQSGATVPGLFLVAVVMVVAGLGFRITAVPFHFYAPDVFQGAPTSMAAVLAFVPKVAGFAALMRVLGLLQTEASSLISDSQVSLLLWILAVITMTVGNVLALLQDDLKRILAYSSVAHAGYMLIGMAAAPELRNATATDHLHGTEAVLFYLVAYGAMTVGAFAVISYLATPERSANTVDDVAGLGRSHPGVALLFTLFLFSLIGMPLTAGFAGKFMLFMSALQVERSPDTQPLFVILAVVAALNGAIGAYYYLRIVAVMFLREPLKPLRPAARIPAMAAIAVCAAVTIVFGIYPLPLAKMAQAAVAPSVKPSVAQASR